MKKPFYGWKVVFAVFMCMLTIYPPVVNSISIFTNPVTTDLGFEVPKFLWYFTILGLSGMLSNSFIGSIFRKYKANYVMAAGLVTVALTLIGFSRSTQLWHFYVLAVFQGIGLSASCVIPPSVLATNWFNDKRGTALGLALAGSGIGGFIFSPVATNIILKYGWRMAYLGSGLIVLLITVPIVLKIVKFEPALINEEPLGGYPTVTGSNLTGITANEMTKTLPFILLVISIVAGGIVVNGLLVNFTPYIQFMGYSPQQGSMILSFSLLFMTLGKLVLGRFYDSVGLQKTFIVILVSSIICLVSLLLAKTFAFGILYTVAFGLASSNALVTPAILTAGLFGQKEFSKKYGLVATFVALAAAVAPVFTGFFTKGGLEGYQMMIYAFMVLIVITYITMVIAERNKPKENI